MNQTPAGLRAKIHDCIYFGLTVLTLSSLTVSKLWMSLFVFFIGINWLIEGNFAEKYRQLKTHSAIFFISGVYLVFIIWFLLPAPSKLGANYLLEKLPLLLYPLVIATSKPFSGKRLRTLLWTYVLTVFAVTCIGLGYLLGNPTLDLREISPFIPLIRFALSVVLSVFILLILIHESVYKKTVNLLSYMLIAWFTGYLLISKSITGLFLLVLCSGVYFLFYYKSRFKYFKAFVLSFFCIGILGITYYSLSLYKNYSTETRYSIEELHQKTPFGNAYTHNFTSLVENGNRIETFVCEEELRNSWNARSLVGYDSLIDKKFPLSIVLIRYLNSMGLKKDGASVNTLSLKDIRKIELGIANQEYTSIFSLKSYLYPIFFGYDLYRLKYSEGSSLFQRIEIWKRSFKKWKEKPVWGFGTGNTRAALMAQREAEPQYLPGKVETPHNQYISFLLSYGVIGFLTILICLFLSVKYHRGFQSPFFGIFFVIMAVSCFFEDIIDTQAGFYFFFAFWTFFLFYKKQDFMTKFAVSYNKITYFCSRLFLKP